jgi:hypothetical protein
VNLLAAPILAILFGGFIAVAEGCNHFDDISQLHWLDMPFHDWFAGGFLIYAGLLARRDWPRPIESGSKIEECLNWQRLRSKA